MAETTQNGAGPTAGTPASVVARIAKIALSDYRAFPAGQNYEFNLGPEGKNLLLFGENGSGKTSLFRALRDLTNRAPGIMDFKNVRHIYAPEEEGFGLDLSNRLPVLKVLNEDFADWQIILMTYDRVWFKLAKEFTEHTDRWTTLNLRELPTVPGQPGRPSWQRKSSSHLRPSRSCSSTSLPRRDGCQPTTS